MLSIGLALLGAYRMIFDVGDWGWLTGACAGALLYPAFAKQSRTVVAAPA